MSAVKINREEFLRTLQSVQPGLSPREIIEQSSCFVFQNGQVMTYNDEVACRSSTPISPKIQGAVQAKPLLAILEKLEEDSLEIEIGESEFIIVGKRRRCGIRMEKEVMLSIGTVETPEEWKDIPEEFNDAVSAVAECAGKDESQFCLTCVHLHPKFVEASDNWQIARFRLKTRIKEEILVRHDSIKHITALGMTEFCETEAWIHFRNPSGLLLSARRYLEEFPDLTEILAVKGTPTVLPKGLGSAIGRAEIFSSENNDDDHIKIKMRAGKIRIKGTGGCGWYEEVRKMPGYKGDPIEFMIGPKLFAEIVKKHTDCEISKDKLKVVDGERFVYVSCLSVASEDDQVPDSNGNGDEEAE